MKNGVDAKPLPSVDEITEWYAYDSETGVWTAKHASPSKRIGDRVGAVTHEGYREIRFKKRHYFEHRLAWKVFYGVDPVGQIDHINRNKADNRIANLRLATPAQNSANRIGATWGKSGFLGVTKMKRKYGVYITFQRKKMWLGLFKTPEEAHATYIAKRRELYGEFAAV